MSHSTFVKGIVVALAAMLAFGGAIWLLNHGRSRPEGVAENWLTAVGDTTRKGVEVDARKRAEKIGPVALAKGLIFADAAAIHRKTGFADLEVGKAQVMPVLGAGTAQQVEVGFRVHALHPNDKTVEITGVLTLVRTAGKWKVAALERGDPTALGVPALPSDGGPPPSSAPLSLWVGGLVGAAIIGVITTALVRAAGRSATAPVTA